MRSFSSLTAARTSVDSLSNASKPSQAGEHDIIEGSFERIGKTTGELEGVVLVPGRRIVDVVILRPE